jgi:Ca2+-binding RTX toxin-like protein
LNKESRKMANINGTNGTNDQLFGTIEDDVINGFSGNDLLFGDAGNDLLDGGLGIDEMRGGIGNDFYVVDNSQDKVIEEAGGGTDILQSLIQSITLPANVETLRLDARLDSVGIGNDLNNLIVGNLDFKHTIFGGAGDDQLQGGNQADRLLGEAGNDTVSGLGGDDILDGGTGNDILNGGDGNDQLTGTTGDVLNGGNGNDLYFSEGAVLNEAADAGIDTVFTAQSHVLGANFENLSLRGNAAINGTGNELNNDIRGNSANNVLKGEAGNDTLGDRGNFINNFESPTGIVDLGDFGDDILDGGAGNDNMAGGVGNDTYIVDSIGDVVIELFDSVPDPESGFLFQGGIDSVQSSVNFTLSNFVENLTLTGTATDGIGNNSNNVIIGNNSNNLLEGGAGNDTLNGGRGNDILRGGAGNDVLVGDRGKDVLTGGAGADSFVFDINAAYNQAAMGKDVVKDFTSRVDKIVLDQTTFGQIARADIALVADDADAAISTKKITYSEETGRLFFNANGTASGFGKGGYFATLQGSPSLVVSDFVIQA